MGEVPSEVLIGDSKNYFSSLRRSVTHHREFRTHKGEVVRLGTDLRLDSRKSSYMSIFLSRRSARCFPFFFALFFP